MNTVLEHLFIRQEVWHLRGNSSVTSATSYYLPLSMLCGIRLFPFDLGQLKANLSLSEHEVKSHSIKWPLIKVNLLFNQYGKCFG